MIRRLGLIVLTLLLVVAAGSMTAFFIFRHPTPAESQEAMRNTVLAPPGSARPCDWTSKR